MYTPNELIYLRNMAMFTTTGAENLADPLLSYFSHWTKLLRALVWYLKGKNVLMQMIRKRKEELSSDHITTHSTSQKVSVRHFQDHTE